MTPRERLKQRAMQLIHEGCTLDIALQRALRDLNSSAIQQCKLLNIKHEIELEILHEEG